jgi:hypothetical protein
MSDKRIAILSFVGGLVFLSVLTTILLNNNGSIRAEVEGQARSFLDTSKEALRQMRLAVAKLGVLTGGGQADREDDTDEQSPTFFLSDGYDSLWQPIEAQNKAYVKSHPSR